MSKEDEKMSTEMTHAKKELERMNKTKRKGIIQSIAKEAYKRNGQALKRLSKN